jgi:hypothetical protein
MAKQEENIKTTNFTKGLVKDFDETYHPEGSWTHARNAVNNSIEGDLGMIGNEPANLSCANAPYTIIGAVHLFASNWVLFSTDDTNSEVGLFIEDQCIYRTIVNDSCLNFNRLNLVTGVSREVFDCSWNVYFADNSNPDRILNIGNPKEWLLDENYIGNNYYQGNKLWPGTQWKEDCNIINSCNICTQTNSLDCNKLLFAEKIKTPCITLDPGTGGTLPNGSYIAFIAYSVGGVRTTDYIAKSNPQALFTHTNFGGSLEINISNLDTDIYDEFELVLVSVVNQQTVAKKLGYYSTNSNKITIDAIDPTLPVVSLEFLSVRTTIFEKSESISTVNNYLLRISPTSKFDFNYQPLANQIKTNWVIVKYPVDYYRKGGNVVGYMRDEVYSFFIRWVYDTGEKSNSFHIPGTHKSNYSPDPTGFDPVGSSYVENYFGDDIAKRFETTNTATADLPINEIVEDGGIAFYKGTPAYWESTEVYPADNPEVWNSTFDPLFSGTTDTKYDLCGKPIRHHKMPEDIINDSAQFSRCSTNASNFGEFINVIGVQFENIKPPVFIDTDGSIKVIKGIVGYEILRGTREGNKSIVAKGMFNNMRSYKLPTDTGGNYNGLFQNYPYNPLGNDPTLSLTDTQVEGYQPYQPFLTKRNYFTFHSPDTQFNNPFLAAKELRLYSEIGSSGNVSGFFEPVPGHPKHKLLTDLSLIVSGLMGMANAARAMKGKQVQTVEAPKVLNLGLIPAGSGSASLNAATGGNPSAATIGASNTALNVGSFLVELFGLDLATAVTGNFNPTNAVYTTYGTNALLFGGIGKGKIFTHEYSEFDQLPGLIKASSGIMIFLSYLSQSTETALELIRATIPYRQYAYRYVSTSTSHKDNVGNSNTSSNKRRAIVDAAYLDNQFQTFTDKTINNLNRSRAVAINVNQNISDCATLTDNTITTIGLTPGRATPTDRFSTSTVSYYGGLKTRNRNQYGQLYNIRQIPTGCTVIVNDNNEIPSEVITSTNQYTLFNQIYTSPIIFGGDTFIGRYTEKNTFFYFYNWLYNQPNGAELDYSKYYAIIYPRYWADTTKYDVNGLIGSVVGNLTNPANWNTPANLNNLDDAALSNPGFGLSDFGQALNFKFAKKQAYFYLFQSGVRDFFVESEINVDLRDWEDQDDKRFFDPYRYTDIQRLFDTSIITTGNYYKYDYSFSISKLYSSFITWGNMQSRDYTPNDSLLCYTKRRNRVIYSLPTNLENKKDYWKYFLANNYKDFRSDITTVKTIGKNGAIILFHDDSPVQFMGVDTLQTDLNTKITIGDGGLFSQPMQSLTNSDLPYEYGSCQNLRSAINTPAGLFYVSQNQGKVFQVGEGLQEISGNGMRWWFSKFLPYTLLQDFPNFEVTDNPVIGIGCQAAYDADDQMLYICKKDYKVKKIPGVNITYLKDNIFLVNGSTKIKLGDPRYFSNTSFTISYDPKNKFWVSFHDWHPDLTLSMKKDFVTTKDESLWRHNYRTDLFCNFYGTDYPFEVEQPTTTGQAVNTVRSLEYILECYRYDADGVDKFHILDENFDRMIVSNTEQVSGLLNIVQMPKNNPLARVSYPIINATNIAVLCEKVEQKYRINQFWDITNDRGEYTASAQPIWSTELNGYIKTLNINNLNYSKFALERKKFRHYLNYVMFIKSVSGSTKMMLKLTNTKLLNSPR